MDLEGRDPILKKEIVSLRVAHSQWSIYGWSIISKEMLE